ncbi:hypothetical protein ABZ354_05360 [Streptomyces sp. NPDC005925]|uniref:hypothetical protein n=1 Tax=Streptomyces sp. NPDC005925 TaxID=3157172 RepID=UPI003400F1C9
MNDTPLTSLSVPTDVRRRVLTAAQLRAHGVTAAETNERCRPGGPWQQVLPGVVLLHPGPPTHEERLHAVLLYATRERTGRVPSQGGSAGPAAPAQTEAVITGLAALSLHGFATAPALLALDAVDVLVPRLRRLRSTGCARIVRAAEMPVPQQVRGLPVAPVERALTDAVTGLTDGGAVRRLLTEAVRDGHCEPATLVRELARARLLGRPHVVAAVDSLLAEGRAVAEDRLYAMVRDYDLPDPVWHAELRLPSGSHLGHVDAYWPDQAVALFLDTRTPGPDNDPLDSEETRRREYLEGLGITVVHVTPRKLRDASEQQAVVIRTALMASVDRDPAAYVVVLPR